MSVTDTIPLIRRLGELFSSVVKAFMYNVVHNVRYVLNNMLFGCISNLYEL